VTFERSNKEMQSLPGSCTSHKASKDAQATTNKRVRFYFGKAKFYEEFRGQLNERQQKGRHADVTGRH
jgi:hypothetical protein